VPWWVRGRRLRSHHRWVFSVDVSHVEDLEASRVSEWPGTYVVQRLFGVCGPPGIQGYASSQKGGCDWSNSSLGELASSKKETGKGNSPAGTLAGMTS
jgi:hypothetical protein